MAVESFLVILWEDVPPETTSKIVAIIGGLGGKVEIITNRGKAIIATFDNSLPENLRRLPFVKLVGGVTIGKRRLARKRIAELE